jgi:hypothetical protein
LEKPCKPTDNDARVVARGEEEWKCREISKYHNDLERGRVSPNKVLGQIQDIVAK